MKRRLSLCLMFLVAALAGPVAAPPLIASAEAHTIIGYTTSSGIVYRAHNSRCGNGSGWWCVNRQVELNSHLNTAHTFEVTYRWREAPNAWPWATRTCGIRVQVDAHSGVMQFLLRSEYCT